MKHTQRCKYSLRPPKTYKCNDDPHVASSKEKPTQLFRSLLADLAVYMRVCATYVCGCENTEGDENKRSDQHSSTERAIMVCSGGKAVNVTLHISQNRLIASKQAISSSAQKLAVVCHWIFDAH